MIRNFPEFPEGIEIVTRHCPEFVIAVVTTLLVISIYIKQKILIRYA